MSDNKDKKKSLAKEMVEISKEIRLSLQYRAMIEWDKGELTGKQCIDDITSLERMIYIDTAELRRRKYGGQVSGSKNG